jgi:hypothetical protein
LLRFRRSQQDTSNLLVADSLLSLQELSTHWIFYSLRSVKVLNESCTHAPSSCVLSSTGKLEFSRPLHGPYTFSEIFSFHSNISEKILQSYMHSLLTLHVRFLPMARSLRLLCPRQESNLHLGVRSALFYPLNYEGIISHSQYTLPQKKNTRKNQNR